MRLACVAVVGLFCGFGCGFDVSGASDSDGDGAIAIVDSSSGGDTLFPIDDGAVHDSSHTDGSPSDTRVDSAIVDSGVDTTPIDTLPPPPDVPPDTCIGTGAPCSSPHDCSTGVVLCDGSCSATELPTVGTSCVSVHSCSSRVACDGSCPDPAGFGDACSKDGCTNGTVQCDLTCALPPTAHTTCLALMCASPVIADCTGRCPAKAPTSGTTCLVCDCGGGARFDVKYDDCGACDSCPSGCTPHM